ncbi:MAG: hypothetical protein ABSC24_05785 [Verrucomicrobiota bacterium]
MKLFGGMLVAGNRHLPGLLELSVNAQLSRLTPVLIQERARVTGHEFGDADLAAGGEAGKK